MPKITEDETYAFPAARPARTRLIAERDIAD
jgi:hypothetical protein